MLTGSPLQVPVVYQVPTGSGAGVRQSRDLIPPEEFNANRAMAETLAAHFRAPNQTKLTAAVEE